MYSNDMKFVDTHEWIKVVDGNIVQVGITQHAQELLGDLVYIELPSIGQFIRVHETIGVIESVKAASDLYSPISGEVIEINEEVIANPTLANNDPHGSAWLFKAKIDNVEDLDKLMNVTEYSKFIGI